MGPVLVGLVEVAGHGVLGRLEGNHLAQSICTEVPIPLTCIIGTANRYRTGILLIKADKFRSPGWMF